jgi:spore germination protein
LGKFRDKLIDWKKRLSDRHMYSVIVMLIAIVAIWGIYQYKRAADLRQELDNQYNRAFYEMVGYVRNVELLLMKSLISSTPEMTAETLQEAWHQANLAQTNLGQLPITQEILASTSKFLSQVGDFSLSLDRQNISGKKINEEQYGTLEKLHGYSVSLLDGLNNLQGAISEGRLKWNVSRIDASSYNPFFVDAFTVTFFEPFPKRFAFITALLFSMGIG